MNPIFKNYIASLLLLFGILLESAEQVRLLIKIPTRSRPAQFIKNLEKFHRNLSKKYDYHFLITSDISDSSMTSRKVIQMLQKYGDHLTIRFSDNKSKIEAYNKDMDEFVDKFDILLVASDDMQPMVENYDEIIVEEMHKHFPDYDGVLHFNDGANVWDCNTMPVIGSKFYKRFNYIYHPSYISLCCDNELSLVSRMLGKVALIDKTIIRHMHPIWGHAKMDSLYERNDSFRYQDLANFHARRAKNFDLSADLLEKHEKMWSILICTLEDRKAKFDHIYNKLMQQINDLNLNSEIEVLYFLDNREHCVGYKRNVLLHKSVGKYVCYVDDDDDVHSNYIKMIYEKLTKEDPDCVNLMGLLTYGGKYSETFVHSIKYTTYFKKDGIYYRPPNHLNPIRKSIAVLFSFPEKNFGEDTDWAMQIARSKMLVKESEITIPYYFYLK